VDRVPLIVRAALAAVLVLGTAAASAAVDPWPAVQIKSSSTGVPIIVGSLNRQASVATSGGAAALRASQMLGIGSSAGATLTLSRGVPLSMLASVARIAAFAYGPVALAGLALTALNWTDGQWMMVEARTRYTAASGTYEAYTEAEALAAYSAVTGHVGYLHAGSWGPSSQITMCRQSSPGNGCWFWSRSGSTVNEEVEAGEGDVEAAISAALVAQPSKAGEVLDEAIKNPQAAAFLQADGQTVSGPATVDGGTQQTVHQGAAGTTTTNKTTTYNLTYSPNTVTVTTTVNTTITHPDSSVETVEESSDAPEGEPPPPPEIPDVCAEHPDASGCAPLGSPADAEDLPEDERSVSFSSEMSAVGSCPGDVALSFMGKSFSFSYTWICGLASGVRPLVLALSWLGAIGWVYSVARGKA
jgi:hypothetical protein